MAKYGSGSIWNYANLTFFIGGTQMGGSHPQFPCPLLLPASVSSVMMRNRLTWTPPPTAALNFQWARTDGPSSYAEESIFWSLVVMGVIGGWKYYSIGYYQPLIPLWYSSFFSLVAYILTLVWKMFEVYK